MLIAFQGGKRKGKEKKRKERKKGEHTEPVTHVGGTTRVGKGFELGDEEVDVALDDGFLLEEGLLAEGVGEGAALAGVIGVIGHCEGC